MGVSPNLNPSLFQKKATQNAKKLKDTLLCINKKAVASTSWKHRQVSNCSQSKNKDCC